MSTTNTNWVDFRALRSSLRFIEVLRSFNVELRIKGDRATGFCPLPGHKGHKGYEGKRHSPSFSANLARNIFQCFGCGAKGNVLDFATLMAGDDPNDTSALRIAALKLQEKFGITSTKPSQKPPDREDAAIAAIAKRHDGDRKGVERNGGKNDNAAKKNDRQVVSRPLVVNATLDFELKHLDPSHSYLYERGFTEHSIKHFGLGYASRGIMQGRIAIPLHDAQDRLIGYAGRLIDDAAISEENPKYRLPGERQKDGVTYEFRKSLLLYNRNRIDAPVDELIVCEGFTSIWWLWQHGLSHAVALMGASCSDEQAKLIVECVKPRGSVWILADGDEAGRRCAHDVLLKVAGHRWCRWLQLDDGMQPTDLDDKQLSHLLEMEVFQADT